MADYQDDTEEGTVHPADPPRGLVDLVDSVQDPQARDVMANAAVRVQDYLVRKQIADDNQAAANRLVSNLGSFKDGLASLASADPGAVSLGVSIAPDMIDGLVSLNPFLPEDQKPAVRDALTKDVQREVVHAGVMSAADKDAEQARRLLAAHDGVLDDADRVNLHGYINTMSMARGMDAEAEARQTAQDIARVTNHAAVNYLSALVDPQTGEAQVPRGWAQAVTSDKDIPPDVTASMLNVYSRVKDGDGQTDWHTFADMTNRIANGQQVPLNEVFSQVGNGLKLADAATLARGSVDQMAPPAQREFRQLDATIQAARKVLAPPEYGVAGDKAFERFMEWMVPQYRNAGPGSLNPKAETYILPSGDDTQTASFWNQFAPRLDDFVLGDRAYPRSLPELVDKTNDRMSLEEIFSRPRRSNADTVENSGRPLNPLRIPVGRTGPWKPPMKP